MSDTLKYSFEMDNNVRIIHVSGSITVRTCRNLEDIMRPITDNGNSIIAMKNVSFVTTSGMESLMLISHKARDRGHIVILLEPPSAIRELAVQMQLHMLLTFANTKDEAMLKIRTFV